MSIRLIALDLDGTLMDADHVTVSPRNLAAIRAAAERGVEILLASGRPLSLMAEVAKTLGCVRYAIAANGASVADLGTGAVLDDRSIDEATTAALLSLFSEYPVPVEFYCEGYPYVDGRWSAERYMKQPPAFMALRAAHNVPVDDLAAALRGRRAQKVNIDGISVPMRDEVLLRMAHLKDLTHTYVSFYDNLEINRADATKGEALSQFCARRGIAPGEVMAFGDGDNDVRMLAWAGWSFAMENGDPRARAAARYTAPDHRESGVAQAIERYVLSP
jgi:Cof subfamily protein (haloacid dehalogenase superfamily)